MTPVKNNPRASDMDLKTTRSEVAEYAMALDFLSKITSSDSEDETIKNILELFDVLFSPKKLSYISLNDGDFGRVYSASPSEENEAAFKNRLIDLSGAYAWTPSGKGFLVKISHKGLALGLLEVDEISFPEYKEHYLNLALSMIDVCGLTIENARKYQRIKDNEEMLRKEKVKLEQALAKVKKLSGLLPICAHCKKIRDDNGYWNQIEAYIHEHSEAEFSHSICPKCAKELYPEFYKGD